MLVFGTAVAGMAADNTIGGYYHVKNAGGEYMNVTGPFTANANCTEGALLNNPGSVFYITMTPEDKGTYVLGNLASQGIDLAKDTYEGDNYADIIGELTLSNLDPMSMVIKGYNYGYTAIARAALSTVFAFVAEHLENHGEGVDGYTKGEFMAVTEDFNKEVLANLDMHLRTQPLAENEMYIFVDMPDFQTVVDWYADPKNHDRFYRATIAMNKWLLDSTDGMFMTTTDFDQLKDWGFDAADYTEFTTLTEPVEVNDVTISEVYTYTFDNVFSNKDFLFYWIKLFAYRLLKNDPDDLYKSLLGTYGDTIGDAAAMLDQHTITRLLFSQLEAFKPDSRIYFISGNVVDGKYNEEEKHLGFAVDQAALEAAGDNAKWTVEPIEEGAAVLSLTLPTEIERWTFKLYTDAKMYDFPVKVNDEDVTLNTIGGIKTKEDLLGNIHRYVELQLAEGGIPAQVPFVIEAKDKASATLCLNAPTAANVPVLEVIVPEQPAPSFTVSDDVVSSMKSRRRVAFSGSGLKGTLLPASNDDLSQLWGTEAQKLYAFGETQKTEKRDGDNVEQTQIDYHSGFTAAGAKDLKANEVVFAEPASASSRATAAPYDQILIGEPQFNTQTGVENVAVDAADGVKTFYDLHGRRVAQPAAGNIYVVDGQKILFR